MSMILIFRKTASKTFKNDHVAADKNRVSQRDIAHDISYAVDLSRYSKDQLRDLVLGQVITQTEFTTELSNREIPC